MTIKNLYISTAVLAVLAVITYFLNKPNVEPKMDPRVGETVVSAEHLRGASSIQLSSGDESVTFVNQPESNQWVVSERSDMPVDFPRLTRQTGSLLASRLEKLVSTNPERIASFGFESGSSVRFLDSEGETMIEIELGKEAEGGRQFLRYKGEEKAFLISDAIRISVDADSWVQKKLVDIAADEIASIDISLISDDSLTAVRDSEDDASWKSDALPEGKELNESAIDRLVSRLVGLNFTKTSSTDSEEVADAKANSHRFVLNTKSDTTYTFSIGRRPEIKVEKEVQRTDDDGNTTKAMEEIVEQEKGPVFVFIESSKADDPINGYMSNLAFEIAEYQFTSLPSSLDDLLNDIPEPDPEPAIEEATEESSTEAEEAPIPVTP